MPHAHRHHQHPPEYHGWTAVPRPLKGFLELVEEKDTKPYTIQEIDVPSSTVAVKTIEYTRTELPEKTFNHSMRVFFYGS